jgi:SAM-dependent methyltransferase
MPDFSKRDTTPELMDTETVDFETFRACLEELAQANVLSLAYRPTIAFFKKLAKEGRLPQGRPLTVLDAGSGYGDTLRKLDRWASARGIEAEFIGIDMNPWSARAAQEATAPGRPIRWVTENIFDYKADAGADVVISSLFTHHLPGSTLTRFLQWMEANTRIGWFINDLERHPLPYHAIKLAFKLTRRHRFMQHDGPVSIASAFKRDDWAHCLDEAGLPADAALIRKRFPFRLCVSRIKASAGSSS